MIAAYDNGLDTRGPIRSFSNKTEGTDAISPYDSLFQAHSDSLSWDWKLLAAVAFKESSFDTAAVSYMGAGGLMQMMPDQIGGRQHAALELRWFLPVRSTRGRTRRAAAP